MGIPAETAQKNHGQLKGEHGGLAPYCDGTFFLSASTMPRSCFARPSKLWSGVTFHFRTPHAGISRSIWSASSLEEASRMKTKARSATGSPPARIFFSASSFKSASKVGKYSLFQNFHSLLRRSESRLPPIQPLNISSSQPPPKTPM